MYPVALFSCAAHVISRHAIARADFHRHIGDANICDNVTDALRRARDIHGSHDETFTQPAA